MQYILNNLVTLTWEITTPGIPIVASDFDVTIQLPSGVTYVENGVTVNLSEDNTSGTITYNFTPQELGLSTITLATGVASTHIRKKHIDLWVLKDTDPNTSTRYTSKTRKIEMPPMGAVLLDNVRHSSLLWYGNGIYHSGQYWFSTERVQNGAFNEYYIIRSADGANWTRVYGSSPGWSSFSSDPTGQHVIAAGTGGDKAVYVSHDYGASFVRVPIAYSGGSFGAGPIMYAPIWNAFILIEYATGTSNWYSTNNGDTWVQLSETGAGRIVPYPDASGNVAYFKSSNILLRSTPTINVFDQSIISNKTRDITFIGKNIAGVTGNAINSNKFYYVDSQGVFTDLEVSNDPAGLPKELTWLIFEFWKEGVIRAFPSNPTIFRDAYVATSLAGPWILDPVWSARVNTPGDWVNHGWIRKDTGGAIIVMQSGKYWLA